MPDALAYVVALRTLALLDPTALPGLGQERLLAELIACKNQLFQRSNL